MCSSNQRRVALEMGYEEEEINDALTKYKFKWAGDLIDYLETPTDEIEELVQKLKLTKIETASSNAINKKKLETVLNFVEHASAGAIASSNDKEVEGASNSTNPTKAQKTLREETEALYKRSICLSCFQRRRCYVVLPCSHFSICDTCEGRIKKCAIRDCLEDIQCVVRTYF